MKQMRFAGIDIGSRTVELVVLESDRLCESLRENVGHDPLETATSLLTSVGYDHLIATGYGRGLLELKQDTPTVTEIKAYAVGARLMLPACRTILDIGGQDIKVIALDARGRVRKFEMNDKCAAGSGKFLEIMAETLEYTMDEFGQVADRSDRFVSINSMCTVFAESEVTSLLHRGAKRDEVARGLHLSVVARTMGMLRRISVAEPLFFAGGVARNPCIRSLLRSQTGCTAFVPDDPQQIGALGAAVLAAASAGMSVNEKKMMSPVADGRG